ncbi:secreted protein containing DUF1566 [Candidatus Magnetomorum sp. HK-1]|nr:secreted protein containing DUF1566 [Candidatus Magnetomorum sp. HK-1]
MTKNIFQTIVLALSIFFCFQHAMAEDQIIYLTTDQSSVSEGDFVTVSVYYDVTNKAKGLTAMGARIHYDSSKLMYKGTTNFFAHKSLQNDAIPVPQNETEEQTDNDTLTDKVLLFSYAVVSGGWPGSYIFDYSVSPPEAVMISFPLKLADFRFQIVRQTKINVTQSSGDTAYGFQGTGLEFTVTSDTPTYYTITATAGDNGSISPDGNVSLEASVNQTFFFHPDEGYLIDKILVDDIQIEVVDSYIFPNISKDHTIHVLFKSAPPIYIFEVTPEVISVGKNSGTTTVQVNANKDWHFSTTNEWLTITQSEQKLMIAFDENPGGNRLGKITITLNETNISKTVDINQEGNIECPIMHPEVSTGLISDSGQEKSADGVDGDDGDYLINPPSFTKLDQFGVALPDDVQSWTMVRDNVTGLIWDIKTDDGSFRDKDNTYYWYDSNPETNEGKAGNEDVMNTENYINQLNEYRLGCHNDWRMPTLNELATLINFGKTSPSAFEVYFPNMQAQNYWSSTSYSAYPSHAICIDFSTGKDQYKDKDNMRLFVRAVLGLKRSGQEKRFIEKGNNITVDTHTGLVWTIRPTLEKKNFNDAVLFCENLTLNGNDQWRIPTIAEMRSILDYNFSFEQPPLKQEEYWSGTIYSDNYAWLFNYHKNFYSKVDYISNTYNVMAVSGGQNIADQTIVIFQPEQGHLYWTGFHLPIHWDTANIDGPVKISIIREFGSEEIISEQTPNTGYFDWIVTGPPTDNAMISISSIDDSSQSGELSFFTIKETHFLPNWRSHPNMPMTLWLQKIEGFDLSYGDEIGIFDGNQCVGRGVFERHLSDNDKLQIVCSAEDGIGNGFTEGHQIVIKIWKANEQVEIFDVYAEYFDMLGNPVIEPGFVKNATYKLVLSQKIIITPISGEGGHIEPSTPVSLEKGASQTFSITPDSCHIISDVLVNGTSKGPVTEYTFEDVQVNQDIRAMFTPKTFTINSSAEAGGTIVPSGNLSYDCGSNQCFSISNNDEYYEIGDIVVDGVSKGAVNEFCFNDIQKDHTIKATFQHAKISQDIELLKGWNTISFEVSIDYTAFKSLIDQNNLLVVRDEAANEIIYNMGSWHYNIQEIQPSQGYRVKVNNSTTFTVKGYPCEFPQEITLKQWNIIGYPCSSEQNAFNFFKPLIDADFLKVVMDQNGYPLVKTENGWDNSIGNLKSGNGYWLQTSADAVNTSFEINCPNLTRKSKRSYKKKSVVSTITRNNGIWEPVWDADLMNPYKSMNVWVVGVSGYDLKTGDQIAVFDNNDCVGIETVSETISRDNPLIIKTSMKYEDTNGFIQDHPITIKYWDSQSEQEICLASDFYDHLTEDIIQNAVFEPEGHIAVTLTAANDVILGLRIMAKFNDNPKCLIDNHPIQKPVQMKNIIQMMQKMAEK